MVKKHHKNKSKKYQHSSTNSVTKIRRIVLPKKKDNLDLQRDLKGGILTGYSDDHSDSDDIDGLSKLPSLSKTVQIFNQKMYLVNEKI